MCSYLRHGLAGTHPKLGGWSWEDLQMLNAGIDWAAWEAQVLPGVLPEGLAAAAAAAAGAPGMAAEAADARAAPAALPADIPVHPSVAAQS